MRQRRQKNFTSAAARRLLRLAGESAKTVDEAVRVVTRRLLDGVCCPPTDLEAVAQRLGVVGFEIARLPYPGELREDRDGFRIVLSPDLPDGRRRFTIAHELAHAVFGQTGARWPRFGDELERMCDMIAVAFLMPAEVFANHLRSGPVSLDDIRRLGRTFRVSLLAAAKRCSEFQPVWVFEVNERKVTSGCPLVPKHTELGKLPTTLKSAVTDALAGERVAREVEVEYGRSWQRRFVEGMPTIKGKRALMLIR